MARKFGMKKKLIAMALSVACISTTLPQGQIVANAEETVTAPSIVSKSSNAIWIDGSSYSENESKDAIKWYRGSDGYYLFLPSNADSENLTVWHSFSGTVKVNGNTLVSGQKTNVFAKPGKYTVTAGSKSYTLHVCHSANVNTLFINTKSGSLSKINSDESKKTTDSGDVVYVSKKGKVGYVGLEKIGARGNSTWNAGKVISKYPYSLKFTDKVDLFGMSGSKKWNMVANAMDRTLVRNKYIYDLARDTKLPNAVDAEWADVYQNGEYIGNYLIATKVEIGGGKINIADLEKETEDANEQVVISKCSKGGNRPTTPAGITDAAKAAANGGVGYKYYNIPNNPEDITGGYLLEYDLDERYAEAKSGFVSARRHKLVIKNPEYASQAQAKYISNYYQEFEDALLAKDGYNGKGKHFTDYIDMDSAAAMYIMEEYSMDNDGGSTSCYLYKDKGGKFVFAPAWDYDWAFGGFNQEELDDTTKLPMQTKTMQCKDENYKPKVTLRLMGLLCQHEEFMDAVVQKWNNVYLPYIKASNGFESSAKTNKLKTLSKYFENLTASANMNYKRFPQCLRVQIWYTSPKGNCNENQAACDTNNKEKILATYDQYCSYLKKFCESRQGFLDGYFNGLGFAYKNTRKVYFDNSNANWNKVYALVTSDTSKTRAIEGKNIGNNIFVFDIPAAYTAVSFKNSAGTTAKQGAVAAKQTIPTTEDSMFVANSGNNNTVGTWTTYVEQVVTPTVKPTEKPGVVSADVATFAFDNTDKTAGTDLNEYVSEDDTYTYNTTSGNATLTATVTGTAKKHIAWSVDEYKAEDGTVVGIVPVVGASKSNNWTASAAVTVKTSTKNVKDLKLSLQLGATKKGPANYVISISDGTNEAVLGNYSLTANKTMQNVSFAIPEQFNNKENVTVKIALANTTTVGGTDLSEAPTGGEFAINNVCINGVYIDGSLAPTAAPTKAPTQKPTVAPTEQPVNNQITVYYKRSSSSLWTNAYAHYKVNGVWSKIPGKAMTKISDSYWKVTLNLGSAETASILFTDGNGSWDSAWDKKYNDKDMGVEGLYNVTATNNYVDSANHVVKAGPNTTVAPTTAPATVAPTTKAPTTTAPATATVAPTQSPVSNTATVYYKRSASTSWKNAYMHYKVDGVWTISPGVAMTKESAGYWKVTVDLGSATEALVDFNTGDGTWDNNSKKHYTVYAGTCLVDQTSKKVTILATQAPAKTTAPTVAPTQVPTQAPTAVPTQAPTAVPTQAPTAVPTAVPTQAPTAVPTQAPTAVPTQAPTAVPTQAPTAVPTQAPTAVPTQAPTAVPTQAPTAVPTAVPTQVPTQAPTAVPTAVPTQAPTVAPTEQPVSNTATVYYKRSASTSWKNAYMHYKVNGVWTISPGVAMTKESAGYWKVTVDLGDATEALVDFNTGDGTWDNNSKKHYTVYAGTCLVDQTSKKVTVLATQAPTKTTTPTTKAPTTVPATVAPTQVPTKVPTTTAPATQAPTVTPTQNPVGNKLTVYYKRSTSTSWKNAYMHYKVNGVWTISPGVAMEKISAGYWKVTVDLGDATEALVDFNTGDGTWDNNSKKHYTVYAGTYLVDQTTKKVTKK
ncbi:MAG: CotH kinase family protein [Lachnospiraceae bacterium]|nr:CotH kinase family protein [Lachnospiraceae bacterium]